ncbi:MAG: hypothetical protein LBK53_07775 [Heliobacteriaceae bacterium]|jgi:hypothetical protein|nr:hypothetical protein [Heliobacteriaceae bacterium]
MVDAISSDRVSYTIPSNQLVNMNPANKREYGRESAGIILQGGAIELKKDGVHVNIPYEKEQEYLAMLAKYNIEARKDS